MALSNTTKIIIIILCVCVLFGLVWWWYNYQPSKKKSESLTTKLVNQGDYQYAEYQQSPGNTHALQNAIESYTEAGINGNEEGALSLARLFLNDDQFYNPERAEQLVRLTLANTNSSIISQRCIDLSEEIAEHLPPQSSQPLYENYTEPPMTSTPMAATTSTSFEIPTHQPRPIPVNLPQMNEPLKISLMDGPSAISTQQSTLEPVRRISSFDFNANNMVPSHTQIPIVKAKKLPNSRARNPPANQQIIVDGKQAEIIEGFGSRVLMMDDEPILLPDNFNLANIDAEILNLMRNMVSHLTPAKEKLEDRMKVRDDSQNVHDSKVVKAAQQIYKRYTSSFGCQWQRGF